MNEYESLSQMSWYHVEQILDKYEALGPIPGIIAPFIESFIPALPLIAILVANVNAYGLWEGMLLSWIGVALGGISVFLIARRFGTRFRGFLERKYPKAKKFIHWVEQHGFTPIFLLSCFPFTPSFLVNIISGISRIPLHSFVTATLLGKGIMILLVSVVGHDIGSLFKHPWKLPLVACFLLAMWLLGRMLESKYMK